MGKPQHPSEIVSSLKSLMRLEYLAMSGALLPKRQVHSILSGKNASKLRGRGLDFEEVRKYVRGDDIRNIDWRVTARTKETHTKVFNEERERPVFTVTDQSSFMFFGSQLYTKSVIAAEAAAISGFRTLGVGDRFGGIVFHDDSYEHIAPKRSRIAVMRYLESVVKYNSKLPDRKRLKSNVDQLNEMLKRTHMAITHDYVVVVISDFMDGNDETVTHLINISMHNDVILVDISDPMDANLPEAKLVITDGEYQIAVDGTDTNTKKAFDEEHQERKNFMKDKLRKYNIATMSLSTDKSVGEQMKDILGKASR